MKQTNSLKDKLPKPTQVDIDNMNMSGILSKNETELLKTIMQKQETNKNPK